MAIIIGKCVYPRPAFRNAPFRLRRIRRAVPVLERTAIPLTRELAILGFSALVALGAGAKPLPPDTLLKPVLGGNWVLQGRPTTYSPQRLFEYIDGEAEHFVAYGLVNAAVGIYQAQTLPARKVTVDVYDMGNSGQAFGVYSSLRSGDVKFVTVGAQGYLAGPILDFWKGRYFVHVSADARFPGFEKAALSMGRDLSADIRGPSRRPSVCLLLPTKRRVANSMKWYRADFLGRAFLKNVAVAAYAVERARPQLFVGAYESEAAARRVLEQYAKALARRATPSPPPAGLPTNSVAVVQPYYDMVVVTHVGPFVAGVLKAPDSQTAVALLKPFVESLKRKRAK